MPSIRKTGKYDIDKKSKSRLKELNHEIIQLKNNQRNIKYPEGKAIYIIKQIINKKVYYKLGRTVECQSLLHLWCNNLAITLATSQNLMVQKI